MYAYLKGTLTYSSPLEIIVETGSIGYRIHIPASVYGALPLIGEMVHIHTSFIVRENSHALYGFLTMQDRDLFDALLGVTGIGPKLALSLSGHISVKELHHAIINHEIASISKVPGIGKKTAERLIIELRDKLNTLFTAEPGDFSLPAQTSPQSLLINDAMSALINLGYNQNTAQKAIKKTLQDASEELDLAALITSALKNI